MPFVLVWVLLSSGPAHSSGLELVEGRSHYRLGIRTEYLAEEQRRLSIEEVRSSSLAGEFVQSEALVPSFGFAKKAYWFRVQVVSRLPRPQAFVLEIPHPVLDHIEFYAERDGKIIRRHTVGDTYPYGNKIVRHYHFLFPLHLEPGQDLRIYLRVKTEGSLQLPLDLWTSEGFVAHAQNHQLFYGIMAGFLLVMIFYNLFLFLAIRDRSYLYYVLSVLSLMFYEGSVVGLCQEYIWPGSPWMAEKGYSVPGLASCFWIVVFTNKFMDMPRLLPTWNRILRAYAAISLLMVLPYLLGPYRFIILFQINWALLGIVLCLVAAVSALAKGFTSARYYLAAWAIFLVSMFIFLSTKLNLLPQTMLTENGQLIGLGLNVILLSLALADRINELRKEKAAMQHSALEVQRRAAETLEQEVRNRTRELQNRTEELRQAYEDLAEHDRLKTQFFSNVSHEVRTPLTLILAPLQRLLAEESGRLPEGVAEKMRAMVGNVQRLLRLVNQLLDFSRLESGGTTVSFEPMDIGPMVENIARSFEGFAHGKGIKLSVSRPDALPEVYVDPPKLDKVVSNLLSNACKFTEGGGKVLVSLSADDSALYIAVTDTGIGIPQDELLHIFERFHQVDGSLSRKHEGTGIGLPLSKELVKLLGGDLCVESRVEFGSTFRVTLPLGTAHISDPSLIRTDMPQQYNVAVAREAAMALTAEAGVQHSARSGSTPPGPANGHDDRPLALVVEDNPEMRGLILEICKESFTVVEAEDGQQALERIRERRPALVISDIMMPVLDGYELVRRLREDPATESLPVLLLTAKTGPEMLAEGLASGANDYLAKPFESQELLARASNLVRMEQQDRQLRQFNEKLQEELVVQSATLERARMLGRYVSPAVVDSIMEQGQPVQVTQERQRLTVFLQELRGFDSMAEDLEPEEMTAMLNGYLSTMMEEALNHGATVDKLNQDVVGGFFGAPTSEGPEQDAIRCALMAQKMWEKAVEICRDWLGHLVKVPPSPTMLLVSGFATVGNFGSSNRLEYTAVGGSVNQARILLPLVNPGQIVCTQSTWSLIKDEVSGKLAQTVQSPQWANPLDLFQLASSVPSEGETMDLSPASTPSSLPAGMGATQGQTPGSVRSGRSSTTLQDPERLRTGTVLGHRYVVDRRIGTGGMGVVYKVTDLKLETAVALKLILKNLRDDPLYLKRLYQEVKLARLISHPNVARIYDLGDWEGLEYITMEYIDGVTLSSRLKEDGALDLDQGIKVFRQICSGLAAAHLAGIIHRDLKPSNVMINREQRVVIMDFGIARWADPVHQDGDVSLNISGTPEFMAPEQFKTVPADQRTDIYALGCVAYGIFTGQKPFPKGDMASLCYQHTQVQPTPPIQVNPMIPPRLSAIIMRCLQKEPADRFARVEEIIALLGGDAGRAGIPYSAQSLGEHGQS